MEPNNSFRAEAQLWLTIAEKLLISRDFVGSKTFAMRVKEYDPNIEIADQILAVAETILSGDKRINGQPDWYAILQLLPQTHDSELIASQYRRLVLLLHPQRNKLAFAEQAFRLVIEAWSVLSNPSKKFLYDNELDLYLKLAPNPNPNPNPIVNHPIGSGSRNEHEVHNIHQLQPPPPQQVQQQETQNPFRISNNSSNNNSFGSSNNEKRVVREDGGGGSRTLHFGHGGQGSSLQSPQQQENQNPFRNVSGNISFSSGGGGNAEKRVREEGPRSMHHFVHDQSSSLHPPPQAQAHTLPQENEIPLKSNEKSVIEEGSRLMHFEEDKDSNFWTTCPYCYYMYEYPKVYADCTIRCQKCKRAFQAVVLESAPPIVDGKDAYFCCWGFFPVGVTMENLEKNKGGGSGWSPFTPMSPFPQVGGKNAGPRIYIDDEDIFVGVSDPSEDSGDEWGKPKRKGRSAKGRVMPARNAKKLQVDEGKNGQGASGEDMQDGFVMEDGVLGPGVVVAESSKKVAASSTRKKPAKVAKNLGKLDLNVEFSNQTEEPAPGMHEGNGAGNGDEDNIGIGFFEGLDEFLSSMPILSGVGDDKVKAA